MLDGMLEFSFTYYMNRELRFSMTIVTFGENFNISTIDYPSIARFRI